MRKLSIKGLHVKLWVNQIVIAQKYECDFQKDFGPIREIHTSSNSGMLDSLRLFEEPFFESDIICSHEMVWYDAPTKV